MHRFEKRDDDKYDVIIGRDVMGQIGLNLLFGTNEFQWGEIKIPMIPRGHWSRKRLEKELELIEEEEDIEENNLLESTYEKPDLQETCNNQTHLDKGKRNKLFAMLKIVEEAFQGILGEWKGRSIDIELKTDAIPYHGRAYKIPQSLKATLKKEIDRLEDIGVLIKNPKSEWAAPTFEIAKKDGKVRIVSDFRQLNTKTRRKPYPLPRIRDLLESIGKLTFATALDLSMGYYHFKLGKKSRDYCTIILPWGKYAYTSLPMGWTGSSDEFQCKVGGLFADLEHVLVYIDDILCISNGTYDEHIQEVEEVLTRLI